MSTLKTLGKKNWDSTRVGNGWGNLRKVHIGYVILIMLCTFHKVRHPNTVFHANTTVLVSSTV